MPNGDKCKPYNDEIIDSPLSCSPKFGYPIYPLFGSKRLEITLGVALAEPLSLTYDTRAKLPTAPSSASFHWPNDRELLGPAWGLNVLRSLTFQPNGTSAGPLPLVLAHRAVGSIHTFKPVDDFTYGPLPDVGDVLSKTSTGWRYLDVGSGRLESYDSAGKLVSIASMDGRSLSVSYSDAATGPEPGLPTSITDQFGRSVSIDYVLRSGQYLISSVTGAGGARTAFDYSGVQLERIYWPDLTTRHFVYEQTGLPWALTGVYDEINTRLNTYQYDNAGRAIGSQLSGGDSYTVEWDKPPSWMVTEDSSQSVSFTKRIYSWDMATGVRVRKNGVLLTEIATRNVLGTPKSTGQSQAAGSGCSASSNAMDYDPAGNIAWREDFQGYRTCYANDPARHLEISRVEGLPKNSSCASVLATGAALPSGTRKVSSTWHPVWRLETKVAEPRRITTKVYNGQPDPFDGGAIATCAPSSATLPDGSAIAVLCKQVEQATSDVNGSQGVSATVDNTVAARIQRWTYNEFGQVLTYTDPLNNTTTNTYYADTTADHTRGDLHTVTNAKNHVATYIRYNPAGQWLEMTDPNDVLFKRTFDARQRLKSLSVGDVTTRYFYWPTGQLQRVTLPDGSTLDYGYDDAQRLTSITDNLGNSVTYVLDNSGNRISEEFKDAGGNLAKTLSRIPDALDRIQQVTGRP
jgi:YD repeat-containing protein